MTIKDLTPRTAGPACRLFRERVLNMTQSQFCEKYHFSNSNICAFENANVMSFTIFLSYIKCGLIEHLPEIDESAIEEEAKFCDIKRKYLAAHGKAHDA